MDHATEKRWVFSCLIAAGVLFSIIAASTSVPAGGADNYAHFNISRWAFRYPHLFLDHWGKPVFTILTAPFAQCGLLGVRIFNIVCGLLTAWFSYQLAIHLKWRYAWFAIVPVVLTPIYFVMMFSGMTEVSFSLFLILSIFLFFKEKYLWSAILISFAFLVRNEGVAILLLFFIGFLIKKQYKYVPFLFVGFILFSFIGWVYHFKDFWWLIKELPYATDVPTVYGSGEWYHFLVKMPRYFGYITPMFLFAGSIILFGEWIKAKMKLHSDAFILFLLVLGSFWGYFSGHSYLWWKTETSAGLLRVMAGVSPLVGILAVFTINTLARIVQKEVFVKASVVVIAVLMMGTSASYYKRAIKHDLTAEILDRVSEWLEKPENIRHKFVIHNPYFAFSTGVDAWDSDVVQYGFSNNSNPGQGLPDSTLFVWDAHFSANEGRLPLDKIMQDPDFEIVTYFEPLIPFKVLGGNDYKVFVFRKASGVNVNNVARLQKIKEDELEHGVYHVEIFDFEDAFPDVNMEAGRLVSDHDTLSAVYTLEGLEFSPTFHMPEKLVDKRVHNQLRVSVDILTEETIYADRLFMVFSVENNMQVFHYDTYELTGKIHNFNVWNNIDHVFLLPQSIINEAVLKVYIWNMDQKKVLIDNFKIELIRVTR